MPMVETWGAGRRGFYLGLDTPFNATKPVDLLRDLDTPFTLPLRRPCQQQQQHRTAPHRTARATSVKIRAQTG